MALECALALVSMTKFWNEPTEASKLQWKRQVFFSHSQHQSASGLATSRDGLATFPSTADPTAILTDVRLGSAVEVTPAPLSGSCLLLEIVDLLKSRNSKVLLVMPTFKMPGGGAACQPNASLCHKHTASCWLRLKSEWVIFKKKKKSFVSLYCCDLVFFNCHLGMDASCAELMMHIAASFFT